MIKEENRDRCKAMLDEETAKSYLCLIGTTDDRTGLDFSGSIRDISEMLANAAMIQSHIRIALKMAVYLLLDHEKNEAKTEANC